MSTSVRTKQSASGVTELGMPIEARPLPLPATARTIPRQGIAGCLGTTCDLKLQSLSSDMQPIGNVGITKMIFAGNGSLNTKGRSRSRPEDIRIAGTFSTGCLSMPLDSNFIVFSLRPIPTRNCHPPPTTHCSHMIMSIAVRLSAKLQPSITAHGPSHHLQSIWHNLDLHLASHLLLPCLVTGRRNDLP
ncbi:hypothetical protein HKX48_006422 [Thoreauomyces humboldtii]|nr:hypothetical protein HKX48_006422 [Thoreauomyces humboldtii]